MERQYIIKKDNCRLVFVKSYYDLTAEGWRVVALYKNIANK